LEKEEKTLMKKGIWSLGFGVLIALMFFTVTALEAEDKTTPPEEIMIENTGYKTDKKGPVKFSHKKHHDQYKVACTECHHEYKDKKNVWKQGEPVKKCAECHDPKKKKGEVLKLNLAYHKNCKNCHKKVDKEDSSKKAPFKKCNDCHQKK
jgi:hypothetical protein